MVLSFVFAGIGDVVPDGADDDFWVEDPAVLGVGDSAVFQGVAVHGD